MSLAQRKHVQLMPSLSRAQLGLSMGSFNPLRGQPMHTPYMSPEHLGIGHPASTQPPHGVPYNPHEPLVNNLDGASGDEELSEAPSEGEEPSTGEQHKPHHVRHRPRHEHEEDAEAASERKRVEFLVKNQARRLADPAWRTRQNLHSRRSRRMKTVVKKTCELYFDNDTEVYLLTHFKHANSFRLFMTPGFERAGAPSHHDVLHAYPPTRITTTSTADTMPDGAESSLAGMPFPPGGYPSFSGFPGLGGGQGMPIAPSFIPGFHGAPAFPVHLASGHQYRGGGGRHVDLVEGPDASFPAHPRRNIMASMPPALHQSGPLCSPDPAAALCSPIRLSAASDAPSTPSPACTSMSRGQDGSWTTPSTPSPAPTEPPRHPGMPAGHVPPEGVPQPSTPIYDQRRLELYPKGNNSQAPRPSRGRFAQVHTPLSNRQTILRVEKPTYKPPRDAAGRLLKRSAK